MSNKNLLVTLSVLALSVLAIMTITLSQGSHYFNPIVPM